PSPRARRLCCEQQAWRPSWPCLRTDRTPYRQTLSAAESPSRQFPPSLDLLLVQPSLPPSSGNARTGDQELSSRLGISPDADPCRQEPCRPKGVWPYPC